jgi:hypothetical protein
LNALAVQPDEIGARWERRETIHFRAVTKTDFVTVDGSDQSFVVANTPPTRSRSG